jgi:hypothetical protein
MADEDQSLTGQNSLMERFPSVTDNEIEADKTNPAIRLYGRRFYKDQTPIEYLAEFLLVFSSAKGESKTDTFSFSIAADAKPIYWPEDRIALKLFSFFPSSKLETRHAVHQSEYIKVLEDLKAKVHGTNEEKEEAIRLIQSLFGGFVGVAKNRTWVTHSFLPASTSLLAREIDWLHSKATRDTELDSWVDATQYFATDRHNFMARGGELLFLQLANLFSKDEHPVLVSLKADCGYEHLQKHLLSDLKTGIEAGLREILTGAARPIDGLAKFVEDTLHLYQLGDEKKRAPLGWVPSASLPEAFLFASELSNISLSKLGALEKLDLLRILCCMQVLRSLCFQASRFDNSVNATEGFFGNYAWTASDANALPGNGTRKLSQSSFERIEELLYRVLRLVANSSRSAVPSFTEADKHGFQIFRKIAKEIGLVIPRTGRGQRFVLTPALLRFFVASLLAPQERVRLTEFYARVFAHYGIALGEQQLVTALAWSGSSSGTKDYAVAANTAWIEEALQQGGFLVELSDAVSIVHNPG